MQFRCVAIATPQVQNALGRCVAQSGGCFVETIEPREELVDTQYLDQVQALVVEFSQFLRVLSQSITDDGRIDAEEAGSIRTRLQRLEARGEAIVQACEQGIFDPERRGNGDEV